MNIQIITGMSGSGKSSVIKVLEDQGYFCADNIPPSLFLQFFELIKHNYRDIDKVAVVVDSRLKTGLGKLVENLRLLKENGYSYKIVFIDASDEEILRRYKETRRRHPLSSEYGNSLKKAIAAEREVLSDVKAIADVIFDTTNVPLNEFTKKIKVYFSVRQEDTMGINVMSFGIKHGMPGECDMVFDVRCLPNPFYIPELKDKRGTDKEVRDYVLQFKESQQFLNKIIDIVEFLLPLYIKEGKTNLVIGFGCTGGNHRSVTFAEVIGNKLKDEGYNVTIDHRDINK